MADFRAITFREYEGPRRPTGAVFVASSCRTVRDGFERCVERLREDPAVERVVVDEKNKRVGTHTADGYRVWAHREWWI